MVPDEDWCAGCLNRCIQYKVCQRDVSPISDRPTTHQLGWPRSAQPATAQRSCNRCSGCSAGAAIPSSAICRGRTRAGCGGSSRGQRCVELMEMSSACHSRTYVGPMHRWQGAPQGELRSAHCPPPGLLMAARDMGWVEKGPRMPQGHRQAGAQLAGHPLLCHTVVMVVAAECWRGSA